MDVFDPLVFLTHSGEVGVCIYKDYKLLGVKMWVYSGFNCGYTASMFLYKCTDEREDVSEDRLEV